MYVVYCNAAAAAIRLAGYRTKEMKLGRVIAGGAWEAEISLL